jgi:hypothetical protein
MLSGEEKLFDVCRFTIVKCFGMGELDGLVSSQIDALRFV